MPAFPCFFVSQVADAKNIHFAKKYWFIPYTLLCSYYKHIHVHAKLIHDLHIDLLISLGRWAQEMLDPTSNKSQKGNQTSGHVPPASSRAHCLWCPEDLRPSRTEGMWGSNTVWGWQRIRLNKRRWTWEHFLEAMQLGLRCYSWSTATWMHSFVSFACSTRVLNAGKKRKHLGNLLAGGSRASISVDPWSDARNGMLLIQTRLWRLTTLGEDEGRPADRTEVEPGLWKIFVIQFGGENLGDQSGDQIWDQSGDQIWDQSGDQIWD